MKAFIFFSLLILLCSCHQTNKKAEKNYAAMSDDSCIIVGLLPTLDCIPFYMAREEGIYDSLGINVKFLYLNSQMDMDVALAKGRVDIGTEDIIRTIILQNKRKNIRFFLSSTRQWQLYANKKIRIHKTNQLGDRMIAITRQSIADYYSDSIASQIKKGILLKPQINNVLLRLRMLNEHQVDAAILPLPISEQAAQMGHSFLTTINCCNEWAGFAVSGKKIKRHTPAEINKLIQGYNLSASKLARQDNLVLPQPLKELFNMDSIPHYKTIRNHFIPLSNARESYIQKAVSWARNKKYVKHSYVTDTLLYKLP